MNKFLQVGSGNLKSISGSIGNNNIIGSFTCREQ